jgi:chemotaxis protein methyltransferase CheR
MPSPLPLAPADLELVRRLVRERSAIVLEDSKRYLVEARLEPVAARAGLPGLAALVERLRREPEGPLHREVVEALTTNETLFFRDRTPFDALEQVVVPALMTARAASRSLDLWCAACSSGQEPYSVAMTLRKRFPGLATWRVRLLATDLSTEMVTRTRDGLYSQLEVNRGLPAPLLLEFFTREGLRWRIKDDLRAMLTVQRLNLIEPWPALGPLDVVFLRNVMIYFDVETRRRILAGVRRVLRPDGYLFLGGAETTVGVDDAFERVPGAEGSVYQLRRS